MISVSASNQVQPNEIIQNNLGHLELWCDMNRLIINAKKTKVMYYWFIFQFPKTYLYDKELMKVDSYKYLGVTLDCNLGFRLHTLLKTLRYM